MSKAQKQLLQIPGDSIRIWEPWWRDDFRRVS